MTELPPEEAPAVPRQTDSSTRAAELVDELARIRAAAQAGQQVIMRLDPSGPHSGFTVGHVSVGLDPSPVPAHAVESLLTAAGEAGVKLLLSEA